MIIKHNQSNQKTHSGWMLIMTLSLLSVTLVVTFWQTSLIKFS